VSRKKKEILYNIPEEDVESNRQGSIDMDNNPNRDSSMVIGNNAD
jgi:hypothetical protein